MAPLAHCRAIDTGYGWTKFTSGHSRRENGQTEIAVAAFQSLPFRRSSDAAITGLSGGPALLDVKIGESTYYVSNDPAKVAPSASTRIAGQHYTESKMYEVCMAAAVKAMEIDEIEHLVIGTPVSNHVAAKANLKDRFGAGIAFDDKQVAIKHLHVTVQPIGGLVWQVFSSNKQSDVNRHPRLLVDVGYGTFDWVTAEGFTANIESSGSGSYGAAKFVQRVVEKIEAGSAVDDNLWLHDAVDRLLISGTSFKYHGRLHRREDYARLIEETAFEAVEFVKGKLGRIGVYDSVLLMGGGAGLYQHALAAAFAGMRLDPFFRVTV